MVTDGGCPAAIAVAFHVVVARMDVKAAVYLSYDFPIDQVFGVQYLHAHVVKVRSYHVKIASNPYDIRIGIIGIENGIPVISVPQVPPMSVFLA